MLEFELAEMAEACLIKNKHIKSSIPEVPFLSRCIDLVLITVDDEVISIEFKVNNWRHAIQQARDHKLGADKAYICLPDRAITTNLVEAVKSAGIGLMVLRIKDDEKFIDVVVQPSTKKQNVDAFRSILLDTIHLISDTAGNNINLACVNC